MTRGITHVADIKTGIIKQNCAFAYGKTYNVTYLYNVVNGTGHNPSLICMAYCVNEV